jgi:hypothetical protein
MLFTREKAIAAAVRSGGLVRHQVALEEGQLDVRQLWMRPEIAELIGAKKLDPPQREVVRAAFNRFVVGGIMTVVTKECSHKEVENLGDIRELKGYSPPLLELRFKPPKHDLRIFGRCIGKDRLVLASHGMKSLTDPTNARPLSVREQCKRCDDIFKMYGIKEEWVPLTMADSFTIVELA